MSGTISIRHKLRSGDLGRIVALHGEAYVARTIAEYILDNEARGRIWLAERNGQLIGCTAIALRNNNTAQLRWVVVDPAARGDGHFVAGLLGIKYALTSPFGFNGAFWYARIAADF